MLDAVRAVRFEEWLYYAAFALAAFTTQVVRITFDSVLFVPKETFEPLGYLICTLLLCAKLVMDREVSWRYVLALCILGVGVASFVVVKAWRFSLIFLFVAAGKNVRLKALAAIALSVQVVLLAIALPSALLGRIESVTVWRMVDGAWRPRLSYGYSHPNMLGQVFLTIACSYAVLRFPQFHAADVLVYIAAGLAAALLVGARTSTVCIAVAGVLAALAPHIVRSRRRMRLASAAALVAFIGLAAISLFMMVAYNPDVGWMSAVDRATSTRFSLAHRFYEVFPPRAFGREIMAVKTEEILQTAPDNAYARAVLKQGLVPAVVLGALCLAAFVHAARSRTWDACMFGLSVYALVGVMEMYAVNFSLNYFLVGCAFVLYGCWPYGVGSEGAKPALKAGES